MIQYVFFATLFLLRRKLGINQIKAIKRTVLLNNVM